MKRILFITAILTSAFLNVRAQTRNIFQKAVETISTVCSTSSEQGHDRLDSLYYLNTKTLSAPFKSKSDKAAVSQCVAEILKVYETNLPTSTGGFNHSGILSDDTIAESRLVSMYYGEDLDPLVIGGKGKNYALLRNQDKDNVLYRKVEGVEWWYEGGRKPRIMFRLFELFGPLSDAHYQTAIEKDLIGQLDRYKDGLASTYPGAGKLNIGMVTSQKSMLLQAIEILGRMYKNSDSNFDKAVVSSINQRVKAYLNAEPRDNEKRKLFNVLDKIKGYQVEVHFKGDISYRYTFGWLERNYQHLRIGSVSWVEAGDPACVTKQLQPLNFLLQVYVENHYDKNL